MSTYRDDLEAAHARIGELEKERQQGVADRRLAALTAERTRVTASLEAPESELAGLLRWKIYVPFAIASVAFLLDGDWFFALLAPVLAVGVRFVARSIASSNKRSEAKHLELLDAEIAKLELR